MDETFTLLPIHMDPATKVVSAPSLSSDVALNTELEALNNTHKHLKELTTPNSVPPPPLPLDPKRSAAIQKMREQGNAAMAKKTAGQAQLQEAAQLYSYAIDMALKRPPWEPSGIVRDEVSILMSNRAQARIGLQEWPEGAVDALTSVDLKPAPGQGKAWWRRARCLMEMGRLNEALDWVNKGLEVESTGEGANDLRGMKKAIEERLEKNGSK
jgi:translocation protein SEC72